MSGFRLQERSVEGLHARVTQTVAGRPLQVAGLALELKWPDIEFMVQRSAKVSELAGGRFLFTSHSHCSVQVQMLND